LEGGSSSNQNHLLYQLSKLITVKPDAAYFWPRKQHIDMMTKHLKNGEGFFEPMYRYIEESSAAEPRNEKLGSLISR
jgi:hypothetical protein